MQARSAALLLAPVLSWLLAGTAPAQIARVDELQVSYGAFVDDFDDGVFPDGGEGKPMLYTVPCGVVTDADESSGRLTLAGPDPVCGVPNLVAENVAGFFAAAGDLEVTGTFVGQVPALNHAYGVIVNDLTGADFATLQVARAAIPQDSVVVVLVDETFSQLPVALAVLGPAATYIPPAGIEVRLSAELTPDGSELLPRGAYRECPALPCDEGIPFTAVADFLGGGGLASGEFHSPGFLAVDISGDVAPTPFAYEIDRFQVQYGAVVDDFADGVVGVPIPYVQVTGASTEEGGALVLSDPDPGFGNAIVALDASSPSEVLGAARFRFQLPSACGNYGLSVVDSPVQDIASLNVVRGVLPGAGDDALAVIAQSEAESQTQFAPIFAQALLSEHPESDPSLADVVAIELELSLEEEPAAATLLPLPTTPRYRPHARYRLCASDDCSDAAFIDLDPAVAVDPGLPVCGATADAFAPPADGGLLLSGEPLSVSMVAAPEPGAGLTCVLALLSVGALARSGRGGGRALTAPAHPARRE
jgi:hypothetical protein